MATTYKAIATVEVGSGGAANIEFTSIPQTYTDLALLFSSKAARAGSPPFTTIAMTFNASTTGYSSITIIGDGSTASSNAGASSHINNMQTSAAGNTNIFGSQYIYIPNYTSTTTNKSVSIDSVSEINATLAYMNLTAGLLSNTAAITSIKLEEPNGPSDWTEHTTATLYGIKNS
jgi:hypothetical protein